MRRLAMLLALAAPLFMICAPAPAARFYVISRSPTAWTVLDPAGAEASGQATRRAWTVRVQKSIVNGGPDQPGYVKSLTDYDCAGRRTRWIRFTLYNAAGAVVMTQKNPSADWSRALGGEGAAALALLCRDRGGEDLPVLSAPSVGDLIVGLFADWAPPGPARDRQ